ncbi:MAG: nucleotide exchange factor GrpE [Spirochaetaceae bacterium]|jgi:molecular chaperone GrpE (heat shock protein)|nr:nucleotide exchange factor GrpE [Spirochaetaceae bacterium]
MLNFEAELDKLLSREIQSFPQYEFAELAAAGQALLAEFEKKQTDISLQIEEIYDLVKEQDTRDLQNAVDTERGRANRLVFTAIGLSDLLEDFCDYAQRSGGGELEHQAELLWEHAGGILAGAGIIRFGEPGQPMDPQLHTVKASAESSFPREHVVRVLQSGYGYQNTIIRKAAVVVSRGPKQETSDTSPSDIGPSDTGPEETADIADDGLGEQEMADDDIWDQNDEDENNR